MSGGGRFGAALAGAATAFAPILWERLPELVHQPRAQWWRDATVAQRLIADAAALAGADAMFLFAAAEAVRETVESGHGGDDVIDALAAGEAAAAGAELAACLRAAGGCAVIAALPDPVALCRALHGEEAEAAEDAFTDLALSYLQAGVDALAVIGDGAEEIAAGVARGCRVAELFGTPVLGLRVGPAEASGWVHDGPELGVLGDAGEWPGLGVRGVVVTPGDVSGRWDAQRLRAAGNEGRER